MWNRHWPLLLGVIVFALVLVWLVARSPHEIAAVMPTPSVERSSLATTPAAPSAPVRVIDQRPPAARDGTLVVSEYGFVGAIGDEAGGTHYLFSHDEETLSVALGGVLNGTWRVDSVEHDRVRLTRLADGVAGVIPYSNAGSGSLELPPDVTVRTAPPRPVSRRSLSRH